MAMDRHYYDRLFAKLRSADELREICEDDVDVILNLFNKHDEDVVRIFFSDRTDDVDCCSAYAVYKYGGKYFYLVAITDIYDDNDSWKSDIEETLDYIKREIKENTVDNLYDMGILMCKRQEQVKDIDIDWQDVIERVGDDDHNRMMISKVMEWQASRVAEKIAEEKRRTQRLLDMKKEQDDNLYVDIMNTIDFFRAGPDGDPFFAEKRSAQQRYLGYSIRKIANDELRNILEKKAREYL